MSRQDLNSRLLICGAACAALLLSACNQPQWSKTTTAAPAAPMPAYPQWASGVIGKRLKMVYPASADCTGSVDGVLAVYGAGKPGVELNGWAYDPSTNRALDRLLVINADETIVGVGQGGVNRPDVPVALPAINSATTGWHSLTGVTNGYIEAWGIVGPKTACFIGRLALANGVAQQAQAPKGNALPQLPAWSASLLGKQFRTGYPNTSRCIGRLDGVAAKYRGNRPGYVLYGWAYDVHGEQPAGRILIVDTHGVVRGAGEGGVPRPDVPASLPDVKSAATGWQASTAPLAGRVDAWGIAKAPKSACFIGSTQLD